MQVVARNLSKKFGNFSAVHDVSFSIEQGKLVGLLGPSGGGKTTLLRMLAGLEQPDQGEIFFNGQLVNQLPPQKRGIGFVFQNYALFKHMTVYDNIAFGLAIQRRNKKHIRSRVEELIDLIGLNGMEHRFPHQLSGGQRQRVAFARALAPEPGLLLLDEPLSAIDAKVRKELRDWLKETIGRVGITSIFVTHDQEEALEIADNIMIIHQGQVEQKGSPLDIYTQPKTTFVAQFTGKSVLIEEAGWNGFESAGAGGKAIIRPEFVEVGLEQEFPASSAAECGVVKDCIFRGSNWQVAVEVQGVTLQAYRSLQQTPLRAGDQVKVLIHRMYQVQDNQIRIVENFLLNDLESVLI